MKIHITHKFGGVDDDRYNDDQFRNSLLELQRVIFFHASNGNFPIIGDVLYSETGLYKITDRILNEEGIEYFVINN
jgi:hypothetical protein